MLGVYMHNRQSKILRGAFFTKEPVSLGPFREWIETIDASNAVEPCAGDGRLCRFLKERLVGTKLEWAMFDIEPFSADVLQRDCLSNFPLGYDLCITNPPYLSSRRAR